MQDNSVEAGVVIEDVGEKESEVDPNEPGVVVVSDEETSGLDPAGPCDCGEHMRKSCHKCPTCSRGMHAFCGEGIGEEGFGQRRMCSGCVAARPDANPPKGSKAVASPAPPPLSPSVPLYAFKDWCNPDPKRHLPTRGTIVLAQLHQGAKNVARWYYFYFIPTK